MSKPFDLKMQSLSTRLLEKFGSKVAVTREGVAIGSAWGVFVTEHSSLHGADPMVQTIVQDRRMKLSYMKIAPEPGDLLTADKGEWKIKSVDRIRPNDLTISYEVEV